MITNNTPTKPYVYLWRDNLHKKYYLGYHTAHNPNYICSSKSMMAEYNKRPKDFKRRILKTGNAKEMALLENQLLKTRQNHFGKRYYNMAYTSEKMFPIIEWTEEMRKKCGHRKGKPLSEETKRKLSRAKKGKPQPNSGMKRPEVAAKVFAKTRGLKRTLEQRLEVSLRFKGKKLSAQHKRKIGLARKGISLPPATEQRKRKVSQSIKEWWRLRRQKQA